MQATPQTCRDDIARSKEVLAQVMRRMALVPPGVPIAGRDLVRRAALMRRLAALEDGLARAKEEAADVACPDCGEPMRRSHTGGGKRRQAAWICPRAEAEVSTDERGHQHRAPDALHPYTRVWTASELGLDSSTL